MNKSSEIEIWKKFLVSKKPANSLKGPYLQKLQDRGA